MHYAEVEKTTSAKIALVRGLKVWVGCHAKLCVWIQMLMKH